MAESEQEQASTGLLGLWKQLSKKKKISIAILGATFLIAIILLIQFFATPKMSTLFRGLDTDSAAAIIARLDEMAVPHTLASGGQEILVPEDRVDHLRITLSSDGSLYGSSVGFELFDQTQLGVSEAERRLSYQRALQGELQRTISQLDGINQARVHLVLPEPSVFLRETAAATASVVLQLNPLSQLGNDQVMGIVYLTAGSVENLNPENVTVIDTQGRILSQVENGGIAGQVHQGSNTVDNLSIKRAFEKEMETRLQGMLERVLGSGTVVAMVTADLDFDAQESTIITYGDPVLRSRSSTDEEYEGTGSLVGGETGTDSNIPAYPYTQAGDGESQYSRLSEIENYEVSETLTHTIRAPGQVDQLSASVIYDNSRGTLSPVQMRELEELIASAMGFSFARGDQVSIASIGFDTTYLEQTITEMEAAVRAERIEMYIKYGIIGIAVLAGLLLIFFIARSVMANMQAQQAYLPQPTGQAVSGEKIKDSTEDIPQEENIKEQIKSMAQKNPEAAVSMLKVWLTEDQR